MRLGLVNLHHLPAAATKAAADLPLGGVVLLSTVGTLDEKAHNPACRENWLFPAILTNSFVNTFLKVVILVTILTNTFIT